VIERDLVGVEGVRCVPDSFSGVGALVLAGSSGRVDLERARVVAGAGAVAESIRWFGGAGQHDGPWEIALELFLDRVAALRAECDRVVLIGTSFGAEAALLTGALSEDVDAVVAFAPSDVVWAGVTGDGRVTSHWTFAGTPLPFVPFAEDWVSEEEPPAYVDLYRRSRELFADRVESAAIPVERIPRVVLVAGGDDLVWPAVTHAHGIRDRRTAHGLESALVTDPDAGHRAILPGEPVVDEGMRIRRGGIEAADRRLGRSAWTQVEPLLRLPG
jgi:acetyl esterase/lipase